MTEMENMHPSQILPLKINIHGGTHTLINDTLFVVLDWINFQDQICSVIT